MVEHDFWHSFLHKKEGEHLGIDLLAKQQGKQHFLTAGEVAFFPKPFDHSGTKEARKYLGTKNKPEMNSILNFPLNTAINRVFIEKKPTGVSPTLVHKSCDWYFWATTPKHHSLTLSK
jgi:hypothetical protein